ncbi:MFS transporter [Sporolactobacillus putidus]|uniref:MFS transporter n=1 Tax=Sporolactobacillus putidus TaxID=492735 RepID=A0A917VZB8_9BACL|nr:MFS transporter [Sporolactobacillus putidus]GGL43091.1 MFS transporter [Sporolactobacillus putidus]
MKKPSREETSWMLYDWAATVFSIVMMTALLPIYFKSAAAGAGMSGPESTAIWGYVNSFATLIIALLAPILGTIADFRGYKKRFFTGFFLLGVLFTALLTWISATQWAAILVCYFIALIGSTGANVFYNAFLVDVTSNERMHQVSARGFALGYIGGSIPFIFCIAIVMLAQNGRLPITVGTASRLSFAITALWWGLFTIPFLKNVKQRYFVERVPRPIATSFRRLFHTIKSVKSYPSVFLFLLAYFFFIDGVGTVITMSTSFGTDLGIGAAQLLLILLVTQWVAAPFAVLYGRLSYLFGAKKMLYSGIAVYIVVCVYAYFMKTALDFWILAMLVATSQGGIQAISRSYFAKLVPKESANEFFGFYSIFGKFSTVLGPLLLAATTQLSGRTNVGILSVAVLFIIGGLILSKVPDHE